MRSLQRKSFETSLTIKGTNSVYATPTISKKHSLLDNPALGATSLPNRILLETLLNVHSCQWSTTHGVQAVFSAAGSHPHITKLISVALWLVEHERLAQRLALRVFFADPHSSWQRGTSENTDGLLRHYLPKWTDLSGYTQCELNAIAQQLNTRPRKCLNGSTPLEVFTQLQHQSPVALRT